MLDYRARRNVGDIVRLHGPYFGSLARVTAFHEMSDPTQIDFVVTEAHNQPYVKNGETGTVIAGYTDLVTPA